MSDLRIYWASDHDGWVNAKGYANHNKAMRKHTSAQDGVSLVDDPDDADAILSICTPPSFERFNDKPHFLFTMYEMGEPPQQWEEGTNKADYIVVPCTHNIDVFRHITDLPIDVCPEGIDPRKYRPYPRVTPNYEAGEKFTFLYVGAPNPRKGYEFVNLGWEIISKRYPDIYKRSQLILKTTKSNDPLGSVRHGYGAIIDTRRLPLAQLIRIYQISHALLLPSMGEGWGLTLMEGAATGLPSIYTHWSGPADYMDPSLGYPVDYTLTKHRAFDRDGSVYHEGTVVMADPESVAARMVEIFEHYGTALSRAQKQADLIRSQFSWNKAGEKLADIIRRRLNG